MGQNSAISIQVDQTNRVVPIQVKIEQGRGKPDPDGESDLRRSSDLASLARILGSISASALVDEALDLAAALGAVGRGDFAAPVEPQPAATITPATVPRLSLYRHFGGSGVVRGNLC